MAVLVTECGDFSEFQDALKKMRKLDDIIVNTLNTVVPTDSFHTDAPSACKDLYQQIKEGNNKRSQTIKNCITITANRVKTLKEQKGAHSDDISIAKALRHEHTKLKMLQVELSVEDLVEQRTAKVFSERCRTYFKPQ